MENRLTAVTPVADPAVARATSEPVATRQTPVSPSDTADLRLVIEEYGASYIYKTVNRLTGEVIAQFPRESMLKLRDEAGYEAGAVIIASA